MYFYEFSGEVHGQTMIPVFPIRSQGKSREKMMSAGISTLFLSLGIIAVICIAITLAGVAARKIKV